MSLDNGPDEVGYTGYRHKVGLDCEEVTDLMDWKPNRWQTEGPKQEEAEEISSICAGTGWHAVW